MVDKLPPPGAKFISQEETNKLDIGEWALHVFFSNADENGKFTEPNILFDSEQAKEDYLASIEGRSPQDLMTWKLPD